MCSQSSSPRALVSTHTRFFPLPIEYTRTAGESTFHLPQTFSWPRPQSNAQTVQQPLPRAPLPSAQQSSRTALAPPTASPTRGSPTDGLDAVPTLHHRSARAPQSPSQFRPEPKGVDGTHRQAGLRDRYPLTAAHVNGRLSDAAWRARYVWESCHSRLMTCTVCCFLLRGWVTIR
jgi:hypothetical protein